MAQFDSWTGRTLGEPTEDQWNALVAYAAEHGRTWKSQLLKDWERSAAGELLQQVRNTFGPRWLMLIDIREPR